MLNRTEAFPNITPAYGLVGNATVQRFVITRENRTDR